MGHEKGKKGRKKVHKQGKEGNKETRRGLKWDKRKERNCTAQCGNMLEKLISIANSPIVHQLPPQIQEELRRKLKLFPPSIIMDSSASLPRFLTVRSDTRRKEREETRKRRPK